MAKKRKKKGQLSFMSSQVLSYVVVAIVVAVGAIILTGFQDNVDNTSTAYTIIAHGLTGMSTFGSWLTLIAVVVAAVVILGFVMGFIIPRMRGSNGSGA